MVLLVRSEHFNLDVRLVIEFTPQIRTTYLDPVDHWFSVNRLESVPLMSVERNRDNNFCILDQYQSFYIMTSVQELTHSSCDSMFYS